MWQEILKDISIDPNAGIASCCEQVRANVIEMLRTVLDIDEYSQLHQGILEDIDEVDSLNCTMLKEWITYYIEEGAKSKTKYYQTISRRLKSIDDDWLDCLGQALFTTN
jgi:hypothetical protein